MPRHRINKLGTRACHRDRSTAAAMFANGTYFLDNPHIYLCTGNIHMESTMNYISLCMYVIHVLPLWFNNKVVMVLTVLSKTILHFCEPEIMMQDLRF